VGYETYRGQLVEALGVWFCRGLSWPSCVAYAERGHCGFGAVSRHACGRRGVGFGGGGDGRSRVGAGRMSRGRLLSDWGCWQPAACCARRTRGPARLCVCYCRCLLVTSGTGKIWAQAAARRLAVGADVDVVLRVRAQVR
jgi:hypothetical protein